VQILDLNIEGKRHQMRESVWKEAGKPKRI